MLSFFLSSSVFLLVETVFSRSVEFNVNLPKSRFERQAFGGFNRPSFINAVHPEIAADGLGQSQMGAGQAAGIPPPQGPLDNGGFRRMTFIEDAQAKQAAIRTEALNRASGNNGLLPQGPQQNRGLQPQGLQQNRVPPPQGQQQNGRLGAPNNNGGQQTGTPNRQGNSGSPVEGRNPAEASPQFGPASLNQESLKGFVDLTSQFAQGGSPSDPSAMQGFLDQLTNFIGNSLGDSVPNPLGDGIKLPDGLGDEQDGSGEDEKSGKEKSGGKSGDKDKSKKKKSGEKSGKGKKGRGNGRK